METDAWVAEQNPLEGQTGKEAAVGRPVSEGLERRAKEVGLVLGGTGEPGEDLHSRDNIICAPWKDDAGSWVAVMGERGLIRGNRTVRRREKPGTNGPVQRRQFTDSRN